MPSMPPKAKGKGEATEEKLQTHLQEQQDEDESAPQVEHGRPHLQMASISLQKRASAEREGAQRRQ